MPKCRTPACERARAHRNMGIFVGLVIGIVGFAVYAGLLTYNPTGGAGGGGAGGAGGTPGKSIAVTGSYVGPQGTVYGAIGNAIFFNGAGGIVAAGALSAASVFSVTVPSGATYTIQLALTGGNAVVYWWNKNTVNVPKYGEDLFTTTYTISPSFIVQPKPVVWTESAFLSNGVVSGTASSVYTANAWGGTQTYTAGVVNLYTAFGAGTQVTVTVSIVVGTAYSQWGIVNSLPNFMSYTIRPLFVFWTNKTDWTLANPGSANAVMMSINSTTRVWIGELPSIICNGVAGATGSASFTLQVPTAGQGQYGINIIVNSTIPWIQQTQDYKVNAPTGYGAVFYGARFVTGHLG